MEYRIVAAASDSIFVTADRLNTEVNPLLAEGWKVLGPATMVVLREDETNRPGTLYIGGYQTLIRQGREVGL